MFQVDPKPIWQAYETLGDAAGTLGTAEETVQTVLGNLQSLRGFESAVERCRGRKALRMCWRITVTMKTECLPTVNRELPVTGK